MVHEYGECLQDSLIILVIGISITDDSLNFNCIHWQFQ